MVETWTMANVVPTNTYLPQNDDAHSSIDTIYMNTVSTKHLLMLELLLEWMILSTSVLL